MATIGGRAFGWSAGNRTLAVVDRQVVHLWDAQSRAKSRDLSLPLTGESLSLRVDMKPLWSPSSHFVLAYVDDIRNSLVVWDANNGSVSSLLRGHHESPRGVLWDPAEQYLFTVADLMHRMWDVATGTRIEEFTSLTPEITSDDMILGIASDDYQKHALSLFKTKRKNPVPLPLPVGRHGIRRKGGR